MLIDTHAHLDFDDYASDLDVVLERAQQSGIGALINVGTNKESSFKSIKLAHAYPFIYAAVGIHPHDASKENNDTVFASIRNALGQDKVVAIGEVGLDYYRNISSPENQRHLFSRFLALYKEYNLPLIIHARDSFDDLFRMLRQEIGERVRGVMHCFSGDEAALYEALSLGLHVSFTGPVTYKKNDALRKLVTLVPDDRLLLETDCPFLAPQSQRGKRNEPSFLSAIAQFIAELRSVCIDDISRLTTRNCHNLFGFPDIDVSPQIVYKIRDSLYINTTKNCTNACTFCIRFYDDVVKGHNLRIANDPSAGQVREALAHYKGNYKEVVFCGFGEPLLRLDFIIELARELKENGTSIRIDTNGHGNHIHKRNIIPELEGLIDELCVSLNAPNASLYNKLCKPQGGARMYDEVIDFIRKAKERIPQVVITFLDLPEVDQEEMKQLASALGVAYRLRHYNRVG